MIIEKQWKLKDIKIMNKGEKIRYLVFHHLKLLKNELMRDGVQSIHFLHLMHHLIGMDIQNNLNNMDQYLTTTPNYHIKLMWQHVRRKHITKL
jgi:hypothetical protein